MAVIVKWVPANVIENMRQRMTTAPSWVPQRATKHMRALGPKAVRRMQYATMQNTYTGALHDSIRAEYENGGLTVLIAPTVMRGRWDGGSLLELGTGPIKNAPWGPIARWAAFKGLPAFPIVYGIRTKGVKEHPFLQHTLDSSEPDLNETLDDIAGDLLAYILSER